MKARAVDLDDRAERERWDRFVTDSDDAWFWLRSDWLLYQRCCRPELASVNRSFLLEERGEALAACGLLEERGDAGVELGAGGAAAPAPAFAAALAGRRRAEVAEAVFAEVDALAARAGAGRVRFRCSPLAPGFEARAASGNPLLEHGFLDASLRTRLLDLEGDERSLFRGMRENHRRNVRRAERVLEIEVYDRASIGSAVFDAYRALHARAAGRVTRPPETFERMHEWIRRGDALLIGARRDSGFVGFALVIVWKGAAYYASGANDPLLERLGIAHLLHWRAMLELRARGIARYELGWQQAPSLHDLPSAKEMSISHFKAGFGGRTLPLFGGEKYYSAALFREVATRRVADFAAWLEGR